MHYISDEKLLSFRIKQLRLDKGKTKTEIASLLNIDLKRYKSLENGSGKLNKDEEKSFKTYYELEDNYFKKEASLQEELDIKSYRLKKDNIKNTSLALGVVLLVCFFVVYFVFVNQKTDIYEIIKVDDLQYQVLENDVFGPGKASCIRYVGAEEEVYIPEAVYNRSGKKYDVVSVDLEGFDNIVYIPKSVISFKGFIEFRKERYIRSNDPITMDFPCKGVVVSEDNPMFDSRENCNCIIEKNTNKLLFACKENSFIPDTVTSIGNYAFTKHNRDYLEIPKSVKTIEYCAFYYSVINIMSLENGVEEIQSDGFFSSWIREIIIPETLKTFDFNNNRGSRLYYIGNNLNGLGQYLYDYHREYFYFYFYSEEEPITSGNYWHYVNGLPTPWNE